jgi:hypothetical protein
MKRGAIVHTCDRIRHSRPTEGLHAQKQHLRQTILINTFPKWDAFPIGVHVNPLVCIVSRIHGQCAPRPEGVVVPTGVGIRRRGIELGHDEDIV